MKANISEYQANNKQESIATWVELLEWVNTTCVSITRSYPQSTFIISLNLTGQTWCKEKNTYKHMCVYI